MNQTMLPAIPAGVSITPLGLHLPEDLTLQQFGDVGKALVASQRALQWAVGDYAAYGERHWGKGYEELGQATGYDYQTLRNLAYVARQIPLSRRRDNLPHALHAEVAALPDADQERWLDAAASETMTRAEIRVAIRQERDTAQKAVAAVDHSSNGTTQHMAPRPAALEIGPRNEPMLAAAARAAAAPLPTSAGTAWKDHGQSVADDDLNEDGYNIRLSASPWGKLSRLVDAWNHRNPANRHSRESYLQALIERDALKVLGE